MSFKICCCKCGMSGCCCCCDDTNQTQSFYFYLIDKDSKNPICGSSFSLYLNTSIIATGNSDINGKVVFDNIPLGKYTLIQSTKPENYALNNDCFYVVVHQTGSKINNTDANLFIITNSIIGSDITLSYHENIHGYNSRVITMHMKAGEKISILPNMFPDKPNHFISWNTDPFFNGHTFYPKDEITIGNNLILYANFESILPIVHPISETQEFIHGFGLPNSKIEVLFPNNTVETTIVNECGNWTIPILTKNLLSGMYIKVSQTEPNMHKSQDVSIIID